MQHTKECMEKTWELWLAARHSINDQLVLQGTKVDFFTTKYLNNKIYKRVQKWFHSYVVS